MKIKYTIVALAMVASAAHLAAGQLPADQAKELQRRDALHVAVQEICPVSGEKLGAMGQPIKAQVGKETVFLCCQGCLNGKINPKHWATIHANFAKAQRVCPVTNHELPKQPKWTIVKGEIVYVCCPSCSEKIAAEPDRYLREVDALYAASLEARKRVR